MARSARQKVSPIRLPRVVPSLEATGPHRASIQNDHAAARAPAEPRPRLSPLPVSRPLPSFRADRNRCVEFKEIRKEWKARKKEEENARKAAEERERQQQQQQQQQSQVDGQPADPSQQGQPANYPAGVRPHLPPIGYTPADGQVPSQYGGQQGGMVYQQGNGQMAYPPANYPHSPYGQGNPNYSQRAYSLLPGASPLY